MVMLYIIHLPLAPQKGGSTGDNRLILLLSNTEKSISYCTGRSAANFIRRINESVFGMCSMTQCRREKQEQPWRYVGSFSNVRKGTGWHAGTDVSAGHRCCLIAQRDATLQGITLLLKSFTSLGILNKNFHGKKIWGWKMKFGNGKAKAFLWSSPWLRDHICMSNRERGGVGCSNWVSYGGALSDSLQRLDGMRSMRHVAAQQTMSIKIKTEQLPRLLSTSILYIEQAWVPAGWGGEASDHISYIYTLHADTSISDAL